MLRIIAYDIPDDRRRRKIMDICKDYGVRHQYSVFACDLEEDVWNVFQKRLQENITPEEDSIIVFPLCKKCRDAQIVLGKAEVYRKPQYYIV